MEFSGLMAAVGFEAAEWTVIAVGAILLVCSFVACAMAFVAAGAARKARDEMTVIAMETRGLLADSQAALSSLRDEAARRDASGYDAPREPVFYDEESRDLDAEAKALENAKTAATVPFALIGRAFRRRR